MMMQTHRQNDNLNIGYNDQLWHKMWKKMQHITLRTNYLQQQNQQNKKLIIVVNSYSKSMNTKTRKAHTWRKRLHTKFQNRKLHVKLQKSYKNITNTMEQEQDEKVNRASMNNEDVHTSCNVFENGKNIKNNYPLSPLC